jgi:hypothetical protein
MREPKVKTENKSHRPRMSDIEVTGVMKERVTPNGRRAIKLRANERVDLRKQKLVESAVVLFLDVDRDHSWQEIATELGITVQHLKDLTKSQEFMDIYSGHFIELGHDPRLRATQSAVADMLPLAVRELRGLITDVNASANARLNAIKEVFRLSGMTEPVSQASDKTELAMFLKNAGMNVETMNIALPPEYLRAMAGEVIDVHPTTRSNPPPEDRIPVSENIPED